MDRAGAEVQSTRRGRRIGNLGRSSAACGRSVELHQTRAKVQHEALPAEEIETEQAVDAYRRGKRVGKDGEGVTLVPEGGDPEEIEARDVFDGASRRYLHSDRAQRRIVADGDQQRGVDQRVRRPGIEGHLKYGIPRWSPDLRAHHDEPGPSIEWVAHTAIAVSAGIWPV